ncbi:MAG: phosphate ABC transporter substrate-binding protein, partial [Cyanobacteria bacterium P01_H01_bin.152]
MSSKNETPVLIASLLITVGLLGGGYWWFTRDGGLSLP